jgi:hypothetical protein
LFAPATLAPDVRESLPAILVPQNDVAGLKLQLGQRLQHLNAVARVPFQVVYNATSLMTIHFLKAQPSNGHAPKLMTGRAGSDSLDLSAGACAASAEETKKQSVDKNRGRFMKSR